MHSSNHRGPCYISHEASSHNRGIYSITWALSSHGLHSFTWAIVSLHGSHHTSHMGHILSSFSLYFTWLSSYHRNHYLFRWSFISSATHSFHHRGKAFISSQNHSSHHRGIHLIIEAFISSHMPLLLYRPLSYLTGIHLITWDLSHHTGTHLWHSSHYLGFVSSHRHSSLAFRRTEDRSKKKEKEKFYRSLHFINNIVIPEHLQYTFTNVSLCYI